MDWTLNVTLGKRDFGQEHMSISAVRKWPVGGLGALCPAVQIPTASCAGCSVLAERDAIFQFFLKPKCD